MTRRQSNIEPIGETDPQRPSVPPVFRCSVCSVDACDHGQVEPFDAIGNPIFPEIKEVRVNSAPITLVDSTAALRSVLDALPMPVLAAAVDGRLAVINAAASDLFGYTPDEVIGLDSDEFFWRAEMQMHSFDVSASGWFESPRQSDAYFDARAKDGRSLHITATVSALPAFDLRLIVVNRALGPGGQIFPFEDGPVGHALRSYLDALPGLAFVKTLDDTCVYANVHCQQITGKTLDQLLGTSEYDLVSPELALQFKDYDEEVIRTGEPSFGTYTPPSVDDGLLGSWLIWKFKLKRPDVAPLLVTFVFNVPSEPIRRSQLLQRDPLVDRMEELAGGGAWSVEMPARTLTHTRGVTTMYELPDDTPLTLQQAMSFFEPKARAALSAAIEQSLVDGEAWKLELRLKTVNGRTVWVKTIGVPCFENGRIVRIVAVFQDITSLHQMREDVESLNRDLERRVSERTAELAAANRALELYSYSISHDLRAPLRAISGFGLLLSKRNAGKLDERSDHYLQNMVTASHRMGAMIEDLLSYAQLGTARVALGPVDCEPIINRVFTTYEERVQELGGTLSYGTPLMRPLGDATLIELIVGNLVDNALKYRRDDVAPHIHITGERVDDRVELRVADNGIGIPPEFHQKIFGVFQRLHNNETFEGTGIGLASVESAVRQLAGEIRVESTVDAGTTFTVSLGAADADAMVS